jgi:hypothetical protein
MPDWAFYAGLAAVGLVIAAVFIRAIRATQAEADHLGGKNPARRADRAKAIARHLRSLNVQCTVCGISADTIIGSGNRFRCPQCKQEFEGPSHMPDFPEDDADNT